MPDKRGSVNAPHALHVFPRVAVLLSTYNGAQYLEQLLNSVLAQRDVAIHIFVRDDGSTDTTRELLHKYEAQHNNMTVCFGTNIGVIASFNELMSLPAIDTFDYLAFCDQDDIWLEEKLSVAVQKLADSEQELPLLYCSNLKVVDSQLLPQGEMYKRKLVPTKQAVLVQSVCTGCTQLFNQRARELYLLGKDCSMEMHDYWMALVCLFMGKLIYDDDAHVLYRQHANNVIGANHTMPHEALQHILATHQSLRLAMLKDFLTTYDCLLAEDDRELITQLVMCEDSIRARLKLFFSPRYMASNSATTLGFKVRVLFNRIY